ncbi:GSCFA domain-containing protein [Brevundimonas pondensis]|jgi:tetratricopeptide (TPR) repeat protein|uniref:GSCFA domain-containing protein n=1 Tax=Brevundimonas pondensis TaxID=2774189 RepID=A0ABX7SI36_9CAUL|nr:GSCFA domain-containing protein [Brevundimonas pondensis]QTC87337.1 GSCFA domain-containing protein [Brevundimonas pondensis]
MPIERIPAEEAFKRFRHNRASVWPDGRKNGARLEGIATVTTTPSFEFSRDTPVLTIGSCFARNIERHLVSLGFDLPMTKVVLPREERVSETANDILNKYSVHSIENELRWAFEPCPVPETALFLQTEDGLWHDPQLAPNIIPAAFERVVERRREVMDATREMARCGLIIITLGLAESWFDLETGLYLNGAPPPAALKRYPGRFALDVLSYGEILESLERIRELVKRHGRPDAKILITTSPVPFKATFSGEDALVANCYSKSVQRAACREFSGMHGDVDYFPSYEVVTLTERKLAFEVDNIHVRHNVVAQIMETVLATYCPGLLQPKAAAPRLTTLEAHETAAAKHFKRGEYEAAAGVLKALFEKYGKDLSDIQRAEHLSKMGVAYLRARQPADGVAALKLALSEDPTNARINYKTGLGLARMKQPQAAVRYFENALALEPGLPDHSWRLGEELFRLGQTERARTLAEKTLQLDPTHAHAQELLEKLNSDA